ncbi:MAG: hypothetical protein A2749_02545 [Parcubacteria group bacterium RIFCSPHIGHO2_01_FULL_45_26]|nr:MAG: hypothetical protein A2749_02545 [Parcubacteria group bacterium RIFCSPHIGHO2_01_FULL_45_26]
MNSKNILLLGLVILLGFFLWGYKRNVGTDKTPALVGNSHPALAAVSEIPRLSASEMFYDFGTISMKKGEVQKEFVISNSSDKEIKLKTILTSCMCTKAYLLRPDGKNKGPFGMPGMGYIPPADELIETGGSRIVRVVYDPNAHGPAGVGQIERTVMLTDSNGGNIRLGIKALVTP